MPNLPSPNMEPAQPSAPGSPLQEARLIFPTAQAPLILEDESIEARFDPGTGALIGLRNKKTSWDAHQRPELGRSFRAFLAKPDDLFNPVEGNRCALAEVKLDDDRRGIHFHWREF